MVVDFGTVIVVGALLVVVVEGRAAVDAGPAPAVVVGDRGVTPATDADAAVVGDAEEPGDVWQPLRASAATSTTNASDAGVAVRGRSVRAIGSASTRSARASAAGRGRDPQTAAQHQAGGQRHGHRSAQAG